MDRADEQILVGLRRPTTAYGDDDEPELELDEEYRPYWGDGGMFGRYFYATTDGTCEGDPTDSFEDLPVGECVGPFGAPRPWGAFAFVDESTTGGENAAVEILEEGGDQMDNEQSEDRVRVLVGLQEKGES